MNEVKKLNKHTIYYFCDDKIRYYINVPHNEFKVTNISLEFLEDVTKYDPELNDIELVKQNIIEYYEKVDNDNITLVMPLLKEEEKNLLLSLNVNKLSFIEKLLALYINSSYITLTKNNVNVNKEVFLIENDKYINFIKYFKDKHNSRIIVKRLIEVSNDDIIPIPIIEDNQTQKENIIIDEKSENIQPFSINENILNDIINLNNEEMNQEKEKYDNSEEVEKNIIIENGNVQDNNIEATNQNNVIKENNSEQLSEIDNNVEKNNTTINEEDKNNSNNTNNVININDLSSLANGAINGTLPGNVTINIERLVTETNDDKNNDKSDDEVSELDEDISDIDEFDENEDFDLDAIDVSEAVLSNDDENKNYRTLTSGGIKFVVGKKDDDNLKPIEINKGTNDLALDDPKLNIEMPTNIIKGDNQINRNAGFASYFTLFFVTISALFLIIYIIIK